MFFLEVSSFVWLNPAGRSPKMTIFEKLLFKNFFRTLKKYPSWSHLAKRKKMFPLDDSDILKSPRQRYLYFREIRSKKIVADFKFRKLCEMAVLSGYKFIVADLDSIREILNFHPDYWSVLNINNMCRTRREVAPDAMRSHDYNPSIWCILPKFCNCSRFSENTKINHFGKIMIFFYSRYSGSARWTVLGHRKIAHRAICVVSKKKHTDFQYLAFKYRLWSKLKIGTINSKICYNWFSSYQSKPGQNWKYLHTVEGFAA